MTLTYIRNSKKHTITMAWPINYYLATFTFQIEPPNYEIILIVGIKTHFSSYRVECAGF